MIVRVQSYQGMKRVTLDDNCTISQFLDQVGALFGLEGKKFAKRIYYDSGLLKRIIEQSYSLSTPLTDYNIKHGTIIYTKLKRDDLNDLENEESEKVPDLSYPPTIGKYCSHSDSIRCCECYKEWELVCRAHGFLKSDYTLAKEYLIDCLARLRQDKNSKDENSAFLNSYMTDISRENYIEKLKGNTLFCLNKEEEYVNITANDKGSSIHPVYIDEKMFSCYTYYYYMRTMENFRLKGISELKEEHFQPEYAILYGRVIPKEQKEINNTEIRSEIMSVYIDVIYVPKQQVIGGVTTVSIDTQSTQKNVAADFVAHSLGLKKLGIMSVVPPRIIDSYNTGDDKDKKITLVSNEVIYAANVAVSREQLTADKYSIILRATPDFHPGSTASKFRDIESFQLNEATLLLARMRHEGSPVMIKPRTNDPDVNPLQQVAFVKPQSVLSFMRSYCDVDLLYTPCGNKIENINKINLDHEFLPVAHKITLDDVYDYYHNRHVGKPFWEKLSNFNLLVFVMCEIVPDKALIRSICSSILTNKPNELTQPSENLINGFWKNIK